MNLHFAAVYANDIGLHGRNWDKLTPTQQACRRSVDYVLESYHYFNKEKMVDKVRLSGERVFLDSGAYSAWTQGSTIDLTEYCNFIKRYSDIITYASALDVIGDAAATFENLQQMEKQGVNVLPCYHQGEDLRYLEYYCAKYEYITLGGLVGTSVYSLMTWLDELWEKYLTDGSGRPRLKVHAFGVTAQTIMTRYPWYSIDSASWRLSAVNGQIFHPDMGTIDIGEKRISRKELNKHFMSLAPQYKAKLGAFIESFGYTIEELSTSDLARSIFNMNSYMEINRRAKARDQVFVTPQPGLF